MRSVVNPLAARWPFLILTGVLIFVGAAYSQGQTNQASPVAAGGSPKMAVVDLVRIFNECAQILDLNEMIRQKNEDYSKEANQRRRTIEDKQTELSAFKPGNPDFETRKKNLIRMNIEANVWLKVAEQEVEQLKFDWTRVVYEKAMQAVTEISKERSFDLVLQKTEFKPFDIEQNIQTLRRLIQDRTVLHNSADLDISDMVIQRMNNAYKSSGGKTTLGSTPSGPTTRPAGAKN